MRLANRAGMLLLLAATTGCLHELSRGRVAPGTSPAPEVAWTPPPGTDTTAHAVKAAAVPPDLLESARHWGLANLVDLALRNSPKTREAWIRSRSAAASLGSVKGGYYPTLGLVMDRTNTKGSAVGGRFSFAQHSFAAALNLTYLLFDFGGRSASTEIARQALIEADWTHNAVIQDLVLEVERAYYQYVYQRSLLESQQANVNEAQANLDAAQGRREAGVGTVADVLQAKTALSRAQLALQTTQGQIQIIKGLLATAVGLPANTPYEVETPPDDLPVREFSQDVDRLIDEAQARRPDLAAARARVLEAQARIRGVKSTGLPSLVTNWNAGMTYYNAMGASNASTVETYNGALLLRIPIYNGYSLQYDLFRAREDARAEGARLEGLSQDATAQVWASYYGLKTAETKLETTRDLLASAQQSYDVALARYKAGVGSILDLLSSQAALDNARAEQAQSRADWHLSLAQLAHDTGTLDLTSDSDTKGTP